MSARTRISPGCGARISAASSNSSIAAVRRGSCRGGGGEADRLMGVGIEGEKRRGHFERLGLLVVAVAAHLPLAVAVGAMRVDGQQFSRVIARGPANSPQGDLQPLGFRHDVLGQQAVNRHVAGHEGQPVGQLEAALTEDSLLTHARGTQGSLVDQLQCQARLDALAGLTAPTAKQIPCSQPQVLGNQKPKADQVAGDLIGQKLPHAAFQADRIAGLGAGAFLGPLGLDLQFTLRATLIEFFFEGRTLRSPAARCEC